MNLTKIISFLRIGDRLACREETWNLAKDTYYEIKHIESRNGRIISLVVENKRGYLVNILEEEKYLNDCFDISSSLQKKISRRILDSFLSICWEKAMQISDSVKIQIKNKEFFLFRNVILQNSVISWAQRFDGSSDNYIKFESQYHEIYSEDQFKNFAIGSFKKDELDELYLKINMDSLNMMHNYFFISSKIQAFSMDSKEFNFEEDPLKDHKFKNYADRNSIEELEDLKSLVSSYIFGRIDDVLAIEYIELLQDILECFELLPSSHGCSSVFKVLRGKEKIKIKSLEHISGKYRSLNLNNSRLLILISILEQYLFKKQILVTKESYCSSEDWRGSFEFIGNRWVNLEELKDLKSRLAKSKLAMIH